MPSARLVIFQLLDLLIKSLTQISDLVIQSIAFLIDLHLALMVASLIRLLYELSRHGWDFSLWGNIDLGSRLPPFPIHVLLVGVLWLVAFPFLLLVPWSLALSLLLNVLRIINMLLFFLSFLLLLSTFHSILRLLLLLLWLSSLLLLASLFFFDLF